MSKFINYLGRNNMTNSFKWIPANTLNAGGLPYGNAISGVG